MTAIKNRLIWRITFLADSADSGEQIWYLRARLSSRLGGHLPLMPGREDQRRAGP
jgi:hypothetical protein